MPDCPLCGPECRCPAYLVAMGAIDEELERKIEPEETE